jgi:aminoglycoside phosphotransferase
VSASAPLALLAPDPALAARDELLVPRDGAEVVRCKYRVGESLRVLYRVGDDLRTVRLAAGGRQRWWTFPDDRRLRGVAELMTAAPSVRRLLAGRSWVASEIAEYAPERSLTVRAVGADGAPSGYVKLYAPGTRDVAGLAARYAAVAAVVDAPAPLAWGAEVLALAALPGLRWADVSSTRAATVVEHLGAAIAALHDVPPPPGTPRFTRLDSSRLDAAASAIAAARPDVAPALRALRRRLAVTRPAGGAVLLHGDCHPKNALVDGDRLGLIDLDQAGTGPAAADLGSFLARLRVATIVGQRTPGAEAELVAAFLAGYDGVRPRPSPRSLRWHTAAALIGEQAVRAVNRVRPDVLTSLPTVVAAAVEEAG